jgi:hypothetical protein
MTERNYAAEMRDIINAATANKSTYVARVVAIEIIENLSTTDPELLDGWLRAGAEQSIVDAIHTRDRSERTHARIVSSREDFNDATANPIRLAGWLYVHYTGVDGVVRPLGQMKRDDLNYIAERYEGQARRLRFEGAFMRALAQKIGTGTVSDTFTDEEITRLRNSIGI